MTQEIRLDIQGLRAVAVVLVVLFHADVAGFSGGFVGVDVFFVVSGYVVTASLFRNHLPFDRAAFGSFVRRRARRILPALAAAVGTTTVLAALLLPSMAQRTAWRTGGASSVIAANWYLAAERAPTGYFASTADLNPLLHTWSLSVEEQFYLGLPIVLLLVGWRVPLASVRRRYLRAFVGFGLVSFGLAIAVVDIIDRYPEWTFYGSPVRAWEFLVGCSLAAVGSDQLRVAHGWALGLLMIFGAAIFFDSNSAVPGLITLIPVLGAALILQTRVPAGPLQWAPLVWIGDRSYGWYLWHWPAIVFAKLWWPTAGWVPLTAAIVALAPATLSYRWLEDPIRRRDRAPNDLRLAVACLAVPLLTVAFLATAETRLSGLDRIENHLASTALPATHDLGCHNQSLVTVPPACTFGEEPSNDRSVLLIGDSNAAQLAAAVIRSGNSLDASVTVVTKSSCPPVVLVVHDGASEEDGCYLWATTNDRELGRATFDVIVIASASDSRIQQRDSGRTGSPISLGPNDPPTSDPRAVAEIYGTALTRLAEHIGPTGAQIIIVHPIPRPLVDGRWKLVDCPTAKVLWAPNLCTISFEDSWDARRDPAVQIEDDVAEHYDWVTTMDLAPALCPTTCEIRNDRGDWLWRDSGHIGIAASDTIQPLFDAALAEAFAE